MLKGEVFDEQIFESEIFALFINTFLNGENGIRNGYKNSMAITYNGSTLTVQSGAVCIQGRFLKEDTSTSISAGTDTAYCKLVIEIDLDEQNTETDFYQASYKVIKGASTYPNLTQNDIVNNNSGVYQYELARFRTSTNGISDFQDMRTFLDFDSIYEEIRQHIQDIDDESAYVLKENVGAITGYAYRKSIPITQNWGTTTVPIDTTIQKGSKFTLENGKIVVGEGVSKALVSASCAGISHREVSGDKSFSILINNATVASFYQSGLSIDAGYVSGATGESLVNVNEGDKISIVVASGYTGNVALLESSLTVIAVE